MHDRAVYLWSTMPRDAASMPPEAHSDKAYEHPLSPRQRKAPGTLLGEITAVSPIETNELTSPQRNADSPCSTN